MEKFGFILVGHNLNGECVYIKSRRYIDYKDPFKAFPFINPSFEKAGYLVVNDFYHDTLFLYSKLSNMLQEQIALSVANGMSKIYIGSPQTIPPYKIGEPIFIYRKYTGNEGKKGYKSCITSFCVVTDIIIAKENGSFKIAFDDLMARISNKSFFNTDSIKSKYDNERTLIVIEMLYYGYFGAGNNLNWVWLKTMDIGEMVILLLFN